MRAMVFLTIILVLSVNVTQPKKYLIDVAENQSDDKQVEGKKNSVNETESKGTNSKSGKFNTKIMIRNTERTTDRDSNENAESGAV